MLFSGKYSNLQKGIHPISIKWWHDSTAQIHPSTAWEQAAVCTAELQVIRRAYDVARMAKSHTHMYCHNQGPFLSVIYISMVLTNESTRYICNVFLHWPRPCPSIDFEKTAQSYINIYIYIYIYEYISACVWCVYICTYICTVASTTIARLIPDYLQTKCVLTEVAFVNTTGLRICSTIGLENTFTIVYLALSNHVFRNNLYQIQTDCIEKYKLIKIHVQTWFIVCFGSGVNLNNCPIKMTWLQK